MALPTWQLMPTGNNDALPQLLWGMQWKANVNDAAGLKHAMMTMTGQPNVLKTRAEQADVRSPDPSYRKRSELSGSGLMSWLPSEGERWWSYDQIITSQPTNILRVTYHQEFDLGYPGAGGPSFNHQHRPTTQGGVQEINIAGGPPGSERTGATGQFAAWQGSMLLKNRLYRHLFCQFNHPTAGYIRWWCNGQFIWELKGVPLGVGGETYPKMGVYTDHTTSNIVMSEAAESIFLNYEHGNGKDFLLHRVNNRLALPSDIASSYPLAPIPVGKTVYSNGGAGTGTSTGTPTTPLEYTSMGDFVTDYAGIYDWDNPAKHIFLPNWFNGVLTWGDKDLVFPNATNKSIRLTAGFEGTEYHSGKLQIKRPRSATRWGGVVHVTKPYAVCAMFGYSDDNGKEIDFELTYQGGVWAFAPNLWLPLVGGVDRDDRSPATSSRPKTRIPWVDRPQKLEAIIFGGSNPRCEFWGDGVKYETFTPADFPDVNVIWDTTTPVDLFFTIERHAGWAGHPSSHYAQASEMIVYSALPGPLPNTTAGGGTTDPTPTGPTPDPNARNLVDVWANPTLGSNDGTGTQSWDPVANLLKLAGTGVSTGSYARFPGFQSVLGARYDLGGMLAVGMNWRLGTTAGGSDVVPNTSVATGSVWGKQYWIGNGQFVHLQINRQGTSEATWSDFAFRETLPQGPVTGGNATATARISPSGSASGVVPVTGNVAGGPALRPSGFGAANFAGVSGSASGGTAPGGSGSGTVRVGGTVAGQASLQPSGSASQGVVNLLPTSSQDLAQWVNYDAATLTEDAAIGGVRMWTIEDTGETRWTRYTYQLALDLTGEHWIRYLVKKKATSTTLASFLIWLNGAAVQGDFHISPVTGEVIWPEAKPARRTEFRVVDKGTHWQVTLKFDFLEEDVISELAYIPGWIDNPPTNYLASAMGSNTFGGLSIFNADPDVDVGGTAQVFGSISPSGSAAGSLGVAPAAAPSTNLLPASANVANAAPWTNELGAVVTEGTARDGSRMWIVEDTNGTGPSALRYTRSTPVNGTRWLQVKVEKNPSATSAANVRLVMNGGALEADFNVNPTTGETIGSRSPNRIDIMLVEDKTTYWLVTCELSFLAEDVIDAFEYRPAFVAFSGGYSNSRLGTNTFGGLALFSSDPLAAPPSSGAGYAVGGVVPFGSASGTVGAAPVGPIASNPPTVINAASGSWPLGEATPNLSFGWTATEGHFLIAVLAPDKVAQLNTPAGWELIGTPHWTGGQVSGAMYGKKSDGTETNLSFTYASGSAVTTSSAMVVEVSGVHPDTPVSQIARNITFASSATGRTTGPLTATTANANELALAFVMTDSLSNQNWAASWGWSDGFEEYRSHGMGPTPAVTHTGAPGISVGVKPLPDAGSPINTTFSWQSGNADDNIAFLVTLRAPEGTSPGSTTGTASGGTSPSGSGAADVDIGGTVSGGTSPTGTGGAAADSSGSATGGTDPSGSGSGETPSAGSATGGVDPSGSALGGTEAGGSATGGTDPSGSAVGEVATLGDALGGASPTGSSAGSVDSTGSGTGGTAPTGSATGDAPSTGAATGGTSPTGSAVGDVPSTGEAAGGVTPEGSATGAAETGTGEAAGGTDPSGSASGDVSTAGQATGGATGSGSSSGSVGVAGDVVGVATPSGSSAGDVSTGGAATGGTAPGGSAAGEVGGVEGTVFGGVEPSGSAGGEGINAGEAVANVTPGGSGAGSVDLSGTASGGATPGGSTSGDAPSTGAATGGTSPTGSAAGDAPTTGTGTGTTTPGGTSEGTVEVTGEVAGGTSPSGSASGTPIDFETATGTATGGTDPSGAASGDVATGGTGSGSATPGGAGSGTVDVSGTASGEATGSGSGVGAVDVSASGSGSITPVGSATGGTEAGGAASGGTSPEGSGTGAVDVGGTASGSTSPTGTGGGNVADEGDATGGGTPGGSGTGAVSVTGEVAGGVTPSGSSSGEGTTDGIAAGGVEPSGFAEGEQVYGELEAQPFFVCVDGQWVPAIVYVHVNGEWVPAPRKRYLNGEWR